MVTTISDARIAPVTEDLTTEDFSLSVLRGLETVHRVDKPNAVGALFAKGEWAVLQNDGTLARAGASPVPNTYPVFCGTDRFDSKATGQSTILMGHHVAKTNRYDSTVSYNVGDGLVVKDLGGGESALTKAAGAEVVLARVVEVGDDFLVYERASN